MQDDMVPRELFDKSCDFADKLITEKAYYARRALYAEDRLKDCQVAAAIGWVLVCFLLIVLAASA